MTNRLRKAFETGYTEDQYMEALRGFFAQKERYELEAKGIEFMDYSDSVFYFKKENKND